jgi:hypothetical protein
LANAPSEILMHSLCRRTRATSSTRRTVFLDFLRFAKVKGRISQFVPPRPMRKQSRQSANMHGVLMAATAPHNIQMPFRRTGIMIVAGEAGKQCQNGTSDSPARLSIYGTRIPRQNHMQAAES